MQTDPSAGSVTWVEEYAMFSVGTSELSQKSHKLD